MDELIYILIALIIGLILGENNMCSKLNGAYDYDHGMCEVVK